MHDKYHRRLNRQVSAHACGIRWRVRVLRFYHFCVFAGVIGQLFFPADMPKWPRQMHTCRIFATGYLSRPFGVCYSQFWRQGSSQENVYPVISYNVAADAGDWAIADLRGARYRSAATAVAATDPAVHGHWWRCSRRLVFVAVHVPSRRIGSACVALTTGLTVGILLGSFIATFINQLLPASAIAACGWRISYFIGGIFSLCVMYFRCWLRETPIFIELQTCKTLARELSLKSIVMSHKKAVAIFMSLTWLLSAALWWLS